MFLNDTRKEYKKYALDKTSVEDNPMDQFNDWYVFAKKHAMFEPNAISISTVSNQQPSCRIVLLKQYDSRGLVFFTNYTSKKGREIDANPLVAATFFWPNIERQIRIEGRVSRTDSDESDAYFNTRPRESQLAAWASDQSEVIEDRMELDARLNYFKERFSGIQVTRPPFWGGYRIHPTYYEFWQGRENRYHDRISYHKHGDDWQMMRLNP